MRLCKGKASLRILAAAITLAAGFGAASSAQAADAKFVLISHAPDSDSWWNTIKNAIKQADEDFNVETDYRNPPNGDIADMARLVEQSAAHNYDGVIVTIADFDVLKSSINKVTAKKIPLVTINSGDAESVHADGPRGQDLLLHVRLLGRHREGDPGRHDPVRDRPAAVSAGLHPGGRARDRQEGAHHRHDEDPPDPRIESEVQGPARNLWPRAVVWTEEHPFGSWIHHEGQSRQGRQERGPVPLIFPA